MNSSLEQWECLYTHMKTQKRKKFRDGKLQVSQNGNKVTLWSEDERQLEEYMIKRGSLEPDMTIDMERYLVEVQQKLSSQASHLHVPLNASQPHRLRQPSSAATRPNCNTEPAPHVKAKFPRLTFQPPRKIATPAASVCVHGTQQLEPFNAAFKEKAIPRSTIPSRLGLSRVRPPQSRYAQPRRSNSEILAMLGVDSPSSMTHSDITTSDVLQFADETAASAKRVVHRQSSVPLGGECVPGSALQRPVKSCAASGASSSGNVDHFSSSPTMDKWSIFADDDDEGPAVVSDTDDTESVSQQAHRIIKQQHFTENKSLRDPPAKDMIKDVILPTANRAVEPYNANKVRLHADSRSGLYFPDPGDDESVRPKRECTIPETFLNELEYRSKLKDAIFEHLSVQLADISNRLAATFDSIDTTGYTVPNEVHTVPSHSRGRQSRVVNSGPKCNCRPSEPSKLVSVKKEGKNHGRMFYACPKPRGSGCNFFLWADQTSQTPQRTSQSKVKASTAPEMEQIYRLQDLACHFECVVAEKKLWSYSRNEDARAKSIHIRLARKSRHDEFGKCDIWAFSRTPEFRSGNTVLAKSVFFGPNTDGEIEIQVLGSAAFRLTPGTVLFGINCFNAASEIFCVDIIESNLRTGSLPIMPNLLNASYRFSDYAADVKRFAPPRQLTNSNHELFLQHDEIVALGESYISMYGLNSDQSTALRAVASMLPTSDRVSTGTQNSLSPIVLVHGVFGSGKSYYVAVLIMFLEKVFEKSSELGDPPGNWRIFISSSTNVAVDRILQSLLDLNFSNFVRVGSAKRIAPRILPYSTHGIGGDKAEMRDLKTMLHEKDLSANERKYIQDSIGKLKRGENAELLASTRVVACTLASCSNECLKGQHFAFQIQDEACQMSEPNAIMPIAKFGCRNLVCVGDPKQLSPTIATEATHGNGLEQSLFERLSKSIPPESFVVLRTQYRCHPSISAIANQISYDGVLLNGIKESDRGPLVAGLPTVRFYNVVNGHEKRVGQSYVNEPEAQLIVTMVELLVDTGIECSKMGVISTYKAQAKLIADRLKDSKFNEASKVLVSTVDAFQGGEREIIFLSSVKTGNTTFIDDISRTNVAITRAKNHLFIFGTIQALQKNKVWGAVLAHCMQHSGCVDSRRGLEHFRDCIEAHSELVANRNDAHHESHDVAPLNMHAEDLLCSSPAELEPGHEDISTRVESEFETDIPSTDAEENIITSAGNDGIENNENNENSQSALCADDSDSSMDIRQRRAKRPRYFTCEKLYSSSENSSGESESPLLDFT